MSASSDALKKYTDYVIETGSGNDETAIELAKDYIVKTTSNMNADEVYKFLYNNNTNVFEGEDVNYTYSDLFNFIDPEGSYRKEFLADNIVNTYGSSKTPGRSLSKTKSDNLLKRDVDEYIANVSRDDKLKSTPPKAVSAALDDIIYQTAVMDEGERASLGVGGTGGTDIEPSFNIPLISKEAEYGKTTYTGTPDTPESDIPSVVKGTRIGFRAIEEDPSIYDFNEDGVVDILDIMQIKDDKGNLSPNRYNENSTVHKHYEDKKADIENRLEGKSAEIDDQAKLWDEQTGWGMMNLFKSGEPLNFLGYKVANIVTSPLNILDAFTDESFFYNASDYEYNPEINEWGDSKHKKLVNDYYKIKAEGERLDDDYEHTESVYNQDQKRFVRTSNLHKSLYGEKDEVTGLGFMRDVTDEQGNNLFNNDDVYEILNTDTRVK
tara:strand:+ start:2205 stop:3512 length:1308 start_codon:yes stop_codon:yes gene_type:complete